MMLDNKKLLITGVITKDSIAWEAARRAQEAGAEIVLTSFGKAMGLTEKCARRLPSAAGEAAPSGHPIRPPSRSAHDRATVPSAQSSGPRARVTCGLSVVRYLLAPRPRSSDG